MGLVEDIVGIIRILELQHTIIIQAEDDPPSFSFMRFYLVAHESVKSYSSEILTFVREEG